MADIFEFWSKMKRGERIHPADISVFERMSAGAHGFNLKCLPAAFGGRLRTAPVVLLYLSPGFSPRDLKDAITNDGQDYYFRRWSGDEPLREITSESTNWVISRTKSFGPFDAIRDKVAMLNIGAYHSKDAKAIRRCWRCRPVGSHWIGRNAFYFRARRRETAS